MLADNPVMAARFAHLTTREDNRPARQRWIHVIITRRGAWDPAAARTTPVRQAA
jgi:hypothetical protein